MFSLGTVDVGVIETRGDAMRAMSLSSQVPYYDSSLHIPTHTAKNKIFLRLNQYPMTACTPAFYDLMEFFFEEDQLIPIYEIVHSLDKETIRICCCGLIPFYFTLISSILGSVTTIPTPLIPHKNYQHYLMVGLNFVLNIHNTLTPHQSQTI